MSVLEVLQHGALLGEEQRAVRTLEDTDPLVEQMLVEVRGEQGLVGEDRVAHCTLVNHFGLLVAEARVLCVDVRMGAGG